MSNKELLEELSQAFNESKKELNIKADFETVDKYFGITDMALSDGFISKKFIRSVNRRILDAYNGWVQFCHSHLMPQPGNILQMEESKCISEKDRETMNEILTKIMELSSRNALNGISQEEDKDGKFIDDAVALWENDVKLKLEKIFTKINKHWKNKKSEAEEKPSYNGVV